MHELRSPKIGPSSKKGKDALSELKLNFGQIQGDLKRLKHYLSVIKEEPSESHGSFLSFMDSLELLRGSLERSKVLHEHFSDNVKSVENQISLRETDEVLHAIKRTFEKDVSRRCFELQIEFERIREELIENSSKFEGEEGLLPTMTKKSDRERDINLQILKLDIALEDIQKALKKVNWISKVYFDNLNEEKDRNTRLSLLDEAYKYSREENESEQISSKNPGKFIAALFIAAWIFIFSFLAAGIFLRIKE